MRTGPIRYASYLLPAALAVKDYCYPSITVVADGKRVFGPKAGFAFIGNIAWRGQKYP